MLKLRQGKKSARKGRAERFDHWDPELEAPTDGTSARHWYRLSLSRGHTGQAIRMDDVSFMHTEGTGLPSGSARINLRKIGRLT